MKGAVMADVREEKIEVLKRELDAFVLEYNETFGDMQMRVIGAMFGRRIRALTGKPVRDFVTECGLFWAVLNKNGGTTIRSRRMPNE
jgi:hypothetical protein